MPTRIFALQIVVLFAAIIGSLTMTAFYGKLKHDRYYTGTIEAVQKTQIELSISMLKLLEKKKAPDKKIQADDFKKAFEPIKFFTPLKVFKGDDLFFESRSRYKVTKPGIFKSLQLEDYLFEFSIYNAPPWFIDDTARFGIGTKATFWRWLSDPVNWFSGKYDFIHVPFLSFFGLFYFFMFALAYRFRANYLGKQVLSTLEEIKSHQLEQRT
jgi:hypothetical protein